MKFSEMTEVKTYVTTAYVKDIAERTKKTGEPYSVLTLFDGSHTVEVSDFNNVPKVLEQRGIVPGVIVDIGIVHKPPYRNVAHVNPTRDASVSLSDFRKTAPINIDEGFDELLRIVERNADGKGRGFAIVTTCILKSLQKEFKHSSAAKGMHHDYIGGLVHHSLGMAKTAEKLCEVYDLDRELLVCGAAIHDIGKLRELETDDLGNATYTPYGRMVGHLLIGACAVRDMWKKCNLDSHSADLHMFMHMIASHHGRTDFGAIKEPLFKEASILFLLDMIDSRIRMYEGVEEEIPEGEFSEKMLFGFGYGDTEKNYVYHPAR